MADDRCKSHQSTSTCGGSTWRKPRYGPRGLNSKIHLAVDAHGMPVRMFVTAGTVAYCSKACELVEGIEAENLLADKGYDSSDFVDSLKKSKITPVIPARSCRKAPREYDKHLYQLRHLVENAFLELKRWRGIATRYAKIPHLSWPRFTLDVLLFGLKIIDDTI